MIPSRVLAQRVELNDEVHARPPEAMAAPLRLSYVAMLSAESNRAEEVARVGDLSRRFGAPPPAPEVNHFSAAMGAFRLRWERHTEFARYTIIVDGTGDDGFESPAVEVVPREWMSTLPGDLLVAVHALLVRDPDRSADQAEVSHRFFAGNPLVGSRIAGGLGTALTDFRIHEDGYARFVVYDHGMSPRQAGHMIQRLLEIDTYRLMALLALPVARELGPFLTRSRHELSELTTALADVRDADEPALLERLTRLEAELGSRDADTYERFAAAEAYYELVRQRNAELREERIQALQTYREFTERRLAPAMATCRAVANRQASLYTRIGRATELLATRVDMTIERQNQALLASMDQRAKLQLRLQETVEGLSVAAITYYVVGLVGYAAEGMHAAGAGIDPVLVTGASIVPVVLLVALGVRRIRRRMMEKT